MVCHWLSIQVFQGPQVEYGVQAVVRQTCNWVSSKEQRGQILQRLQFSYIMELEEKQNNDYTSFWEELYPQEWISDYVEWSVLKYLF